MSGSGETEQVEDGGMSWSYAAGMWFTVLTTLHASAAIASASMDQCGFVVFNGLLAMIYAAIVTHFIRKSRESE